MSGIFILQFRFNNSNMLENVVEVGFHFHQNTNIRLIVFDCERVKCLHGMFIETAQVLIGFIQTTNSNLSHTRN